MTDAAVDIAEPRLDVRTRTTAHHSGGWSRFQITALFLCTAAVVALGLLDLTRQALSTDAAATRLFATTPGAAGIGEGGGNMAFYYLLMHLLVGRFGATRFVLRFPSIVAGAASVIIVAQLGRRVGNRTIGVWSAAFFSISLPFLAFSRGARGYALGTFFVAAGMLAWLSFVREPNVVRGATYVMLMTVASYTLLLAWWALLAQGLVWVRSLVCDRRGNGESGADARGKTAVGLAIGAVLLCTAPLGVLAARIGMSSLVDERNRITLARLAHTAMVLTSGENGIGVAPWKAAAATLAVVTVFLWAVALWTSRDHRIDGPGVLDTGDATLLATWLALPVLGQVLVSILVHPMYQYRYFALCLPAAAILAACGLESVRRAGWLKFATCAGLVLLGAHAMFIASLYH